MNMQNEYILSHVLSRGVDKRQIFLDEKDYIRFISSLFEFNTEERIENNSYLFKNFGSYIDIVSQYNKKSNLLVDIHAFCLMPNHYHLLLSPRKKDGISKFMQKVNIGYAKYFNKKYERKGTLFESRFKSILIDNQAYFTYIPFYIHLNPLDFKFKEWRDHKLTDYHGAMDFLNSYKWSSHLDYLGANKFSYLLQKELLNELLGGPVGYQKQLNSWLKEINLNRISFLTLE